MGLMKRWSCLLMVLVVGLLLLPLCVGLMLLLTIKTAFAAEPDAVLLAAARPAAAPAATAHGEFLRRHVSVPIPNAACVVRLAGDPSGIEPFAVDDRLTLIAHRRDGTAPRWFHDFRVAGRIELFPPTDITSALGTDLSDLEVVLEDLEPNTWSNTALWLLPCAASTSVATPTLRRPSPTPPPTQPPSPPETSPTPTRSTGSGIDRPSGGTIPGVPSNRVPPANLGLDVGFWLLLITVPISGVAWLFLRRRHSLVVLPRIYQVNIYDVNSPQQYQEEIARERFPIGIARTPLRLVAPDAPNAICTLALTPSTPLPILRGKTATVPLRIQVDGQRLALEPEPSSGNATPVLEQEHSHA